MAKKDENEYISPFDNLEDKFNSTKIALDLSERLDKYVELDSLRINKERTAFGIYGSWGSGKSTIIDEVCYKRNSNKEGYIKIIKIDLWKYELYDDDLGAIAAEIMKMLREYIKKWKKTKSFFKKIVEALYRSGKSINAGIPNFGVALNFDSKKGNNNLYESIESSDFKEANTKILVIFDELDRCSKTNIERYLNFIKHISLNLSSNIFSAIVMDPSYIKDIVFDDKEDRMWGFLNKIIGNHFNIEEKLLFKASANNDWLIDKTLLHKIYSRFSLLPRDMVLVLDKSNAILKKIFSDDFGRFVKRVEFKNALRGLVYTFVAIKFSSDKLNDVDFHSKMIQFHANLENYKNAYASKHMNSLFLKQLFNEQHDVTSLVINFLKLKITNFLESKISLKFVNNCREEIKCTFSKTNDYWNGFVEQLANTMVLKIMKDDGSDNVKDKSFLSIFGLLDNVKEKIETEISKKFDSLDFNEIKEWIKYKGPMVRFNTQYTGYGDYYVNGDKILEFVLNSQNGPYNNITIIINDSPKDNDVFGWANNSLLNCFLFLSNDEEWLEAGEVEKNKLLSFIINEVTIIEV